MLELAEYEGKVVAAHITVFYGKSSRSRFRVRWAVISIDILGNQLSSKDATGGAKRGCFWLKTTKLSILSHFLSSMFYNPGVK
jgi:hypothetical protein